MSKFSFRFFLSAMFLLLLIDGGAAEVLPLPLPSHGDVCDGGVVSKKLLAKYIIELTDTKDSKLAGKLIFGDAVLWRSIFTEETKKFCSADAVCRRKGLVADD